MGNEKKILQHYTAGMYIDLAFRGYFVRVSPVLTGKKLERQGQSFQVTALLTVLTIQFPPLERISGVAGTA